MLDSFLDCFGYTIDPHESGRKYAYHTDLAHYFPGRKRSSSGDHTPAQEEIDHSRAWLEREIEIVGPRVIVLLGRQPAAVFLERYAGLTVKRLDEVLARVIECRIAGGVVPAIAVHHPSGAFQHPLPGTRIAERVGRYLACSGRARLDADD